MQGNNDCGVGQDLLLAVEGSIVVNAALTDGAIENNRRLCIANNYPSLVMTERPDIILFLPTLLKVPTTTWQEVAP